MKKTSIKERQRQYKDKYNREFPYRWFRYCLEPIEWIEGWDVMINDKSGQQWILHHRDELQEDVVVKRDELKSRGELYYLHASKLVFMTKHDHLSLHNTGENNTMHGKTGELCPNYGRNKHGITKENLYELYIVQRLSSRKIGEKFGCGHKLILDYLRKFGISRK